ncbi:PLP-dependent aminotransferase family protein [Kocuria tytonicola]|uniref:PLP-dependent aminotransferase family protein n=1 Tax=Kocuria tytonicola TaxID=2055946 RepID=A0A3L9L570_9MICC|nr:PLP-dependent aminotransferase family protein [Kocuria tytonicola]RLY93805.1 PLP-dependent aminotransferase family protein [Kocuria tytonicola]
MSTSETFSFRIADRLRGVDSSPVRDLLDVVSREGVISFAGGVPDPEYFEVADIKAAYDWVFEHQPQRALQYASSEGERELREQAARRISRHLPTTAEQIQVTTGSQEGLFVVAQALVNPGDTILVERPTYLAAVQAFDLNGAHMVGVPTDEHGVLPDELERLIGEHAPKFVYLIPSFQNPSGICMSVERRQAVADVLRRTGTALVEDDPYGELCYTGEPLAPIASLPGMSAQTILLNSVSKIIAPGVRVGWMRSEGPIQFTLTVAKQAIGLQSPVPDQLAVARYLETADVEAHLERVRPVYAERARAMYAELETVLPAGAQITRPDGGMFLWVRLGHGIDTTRLLQLAVAEGVAFVPGESFYAHDPDTSTMRLSFVTHGPEKIREGVDRLRRALERYEAERG